MRLSPAAVGRQKKHSRWCQNTFTHAINLKETKAHGCVDMWLSELYSLQFVVLDEKFSAKWLEMLRIYYTKYMHK